LVATEFICTVAVLEYFETQVINVIQHIASVSGNTIPSTMPFHFVSVLRLCVIIR